MLTVDKCSAKEAHPLHHHAVITKPTTEVLWLYILRQRLPPKTVLCVDSRR